jgi:hypothetical protein
VDNGSGLFCLLWTESLVRFNANVGCVLLNFAEWDLNILLGAMIVNAYNNLKFISGKQEKKSKFTIVGVGMCIKSEQIACASSIRCFMCSNDCLLNAVYNINTQYELR